VRQFGGRAGCPPAIGRAARSWETAIDACVFSRPTSYAADKAAQQFGLFGRFVKEQTQKALAGDLPRHFVLAVTAEDVVVLERRMGTTHGAMGQPGPEVARWRRATLNVTWKDGGYVYDASITAPDATDRHRCCVGKMPLSEDFLRLLTDPARMTPAA